MQEPRTGRAAGGSSDAGTNGRGGVPVHPVDRSHLLRRSSEFPFPMPMNNGIVRIRRERRVFGSFSGIRALARDRKP